jgi:hypothetical protein
VRALLKCVDGITFFVHVPDPPPGHKLHTLEKDGIVYQFAGMKRHNTAVFIEMSGQRINDCQHHVCDCLASELKRMQKDIENLQELGLAMQEAITKHVPDAELRGKIWTDSIESSIYAKQAWDDMKEQLVPKKGQPNDDRN